jgi:glycopeptide antibiotics resistance protein
VLYLKLFLIYAIIVLLLHIIPIGVNDIALDEIEFIIFRGDYLLHTAIFLPWMIFIWLYLNTNNIHGSTRRKYAIVWFCTGVFLAVFAEGIQYWITYRGFNVIDIVYNVLGVILGGLIFLHTPASLRDRRLKISRSNKHVV